MHELGVDFDYFFSFLGFNILVVFQFLYMQTTHIKWTGFLLVNDYFYRCYKTPPARTPENVMHVNLCLCNLKATHILTRNSCSTTVRILCHLEGDKAYSHPVRRRWLICRNLILRQCFC